MTVGTQERIAMRAYENLPVPIRKALTGWVNVKDVYCVLNPNPDTVHVIERHSPSVWSLTTAFVITRTDREDWAVSADVQRKAIEEVLAYLHRRLA
jgi:hypothetical protein